MITADSRGRLGLTVRWDRIQVGVSGNIRSGFQNRCKQCVRVGMTRSVKQLIGRCGNSGRSPVPHLHMQVQRTPQIGDKTVPYRLTQYIENNRYHTSGIPQKDATIRPVEFNDAIAAFFEFGETTWTCHWNGRPQTIRCWRVRTR